MSKRKRIKRRTNAPSLPSSHWDCLPFQLIPEFYRMGQASTAQTIERAPECHEACSLNAALSFFLGVFLPTVKYEDKEELRRLAQLLLPDIVKLLAIASKSTVPKTVICSISSPDASLN